MEIPFLSFITIDFIAKIFLLIFLFLYTVFALILLNQVRSLNRVLQITSFAGSRMIFWIAVLHLLLAAFLFFLTLVIL